MTPAQFLRIADAFPDAALLVRSDGMILAANRSLSRLGVERGHVVEQSLHDIASTPSGSIGDLLGSFARSGSPLPGVLMLRASPEVCYRCHGSLVEPPQGERPGQLLLRLTPQRTAIGRFTALNDKIRQLNGEIRRRREQEAEVRRQREQLATTLNSIGDAVIVTDLEQRVRAINPIAESLIGWSQADAVGSPLASVFRIINEHSRQSVENPVEKVLASGAIHGLANHTVLIARDGREYPIEDSAAPIRDEQGRVYGVVLIFRDVTRERESLRRLQQSEERFRQLAEHIHDVFYVIDIRESRLLYISPAYETVWERDCRSLYQDPQSFLEAIVEEDRPRVLEALQRQRRGESTREEYRIRSPQGVLKWIHDRAFPVRDEQGRVVRVAGVAADVTERKRIEQDLRFLSQASRTLATLVDYESTLQRVARLAVPHYADWCVVHMDKGDGVLQQLAVAHTDPAKLALAQEVSSRYPPDPEALAGAAHVFRTGEAEMQEEITDDLLQAGARDAEHLRILRELGLKSYMCVPLAVRGRTLGVLTFIAAESTRRYTEGDLEVAKDLAHRAAVAIENAQLYADLKDADRRKDEFLAMLAHELRNPLAPIRSGLDLLAASDADSEVVELMRHQLEHLVRLVDDLLDVSRIMRGRVRLRRQETPLAEAVARAVETAKPLVEEHEHELTVQLPDEPVLLYVDPVRLSQVISNLLTNAAKYTETGGRIWLAAERHPQEAIIRVRDTGVGIEPDLLPHVFELFRQSEQAIDRSQGGLGIGLTIVKSLVEMHGGTIAVRSEGKGQGSEFTLRLPIKSAARTEPERKGAPAAGGEHRVLVVDDNVGAAKMLALLLKRVGGHAVSMAHDGPAAIAAAEKERPDLILLDIGLPGMSGYEVVQQLRSTAELAGTLIVALTGYGTAEDRRKSLEAGFDEHLVKPPSLESLQRLFAHPKLGSVE